MLEAKVFIKNIFQGVVSSVTNTQFMLDQEHNIYEGNRSQFAANYSLPKATVSFSVGVNIKKGGKIFFFFGKEIHLKRNAHTIKFSLVATPDKPEQFDSNVKNIQFRLIEPYFLLPLKEEDKIFNHLFSALKSGDWEYEFAQGVKSSKKNREKIKNKLENEINRIAEAKEKEHRLLYFRLDSNPGSILIVRLAKKNNKDGLYILTPGNSPSVTIYNFEGDGIRRLSYKVIHNFILTIRKWLKESSNSSSMYSLNDKKNFGLKPLDNFIKDLAPLYLDGLKLLANQKVEVSKTLPTTYYDLQSVQAGLYFSVQFLDDGIEKDTDKLTADFDRNNSDNVDGSDNQVAIQAFLRDGIPNIEIKLVEFEFILTGDERQEFIKLLVRNSGEIAKIMAKKSGVPESSYKTFIEGTDHQGGVVIFSSVIDKRKEFLIIWPGISNDKNRDFIFKCAKKVIDSTEVIDKKSIKKVMDLDTDTNKIDIDSGETETLGEEEVSIDTAITKDEFKMFHRVFNAVRVWRNR